MYVGYSPAIGIDAARMVKDFPDMKIIHIVRNPFSAYRDTKRRPFPQPLSKYLITWNIYHSTVEMYAKMYPKNVRIFRYEDLVADKSKFMNCQMQRSSRLYMVQQRWHDILDMIRLII